MKTVPELTADLNSSRQETVSLTTVKNCGIHGVYMHPKIHIKEGE